MCRTTAAFQPAGSLAAVGARQQKRTSLPLRPTASLQQQAAVQTLQGTGVREASNIVPAELGRRAELEAQARALLQRDSAWHEAPCPPNMVHARSKAEFKQLITGAGPGRLVVVDYLSPGCNGCRTLFPKLRQIAENNADCLFVKVNTESDEMRELAAGLGVTKLPYFQCWRDSDLVAAFTANLSTVAVLRAEIARNKECTSPGCDM